VLTFFAIVGVIYVTECLYRVDTGAIVLTGARRGRWRVCIGPMLTLGGKGGASVAPLLPPLATPVAWPGDVARLASLAGGPAAALSKKAQNEVVDRIDRFYEVVEPLRVACNSLWIFVFGLAPVIVFWRGLAGTWPELLLLGLAFLGFTLVVFWRGHRRLYPEARGERRSKTILMGVSPLGAIRAADHLSHRLLAGAHPLVAAVALCPREEAVRLARWLYFAPDGQDPDVRRYLESSDLWDAVAAPPRLEEMGAAAFCPRCHAQYVRASGECSDCAGVGLVKRAEAPALPAVIHE
jgi:hypothetical protein